MVYYYIYYWNLQFLNNVIINKTNVIFPQAYMTLDVFLAILFRPFGFNAPRNFNHLSFQSFDFERIWLRLFQKRVVCTNYDVYVFID